VIKLFTFGFTRLCFLSRIAGGGSTPQSRASSRPASRSTTPVPGASRPVNDFCLPGVSSSSGNNKFEGAGSAAKKNRPGATEYLGVLGSPPRSRRTLRRKVRIYMHG